ncbi:hypothetical protein SAMN00808754_1701 [Thermanaeromonas toyohensis ToBE]|uniref:Uncharacterized protein n=1 Tax=Thermanaeromonas toyohensis ToBE TaxID=698762 RepID=A0A1W1VU44_9FIRM|nr:hypothetical protein [Thermanaeromonas toyohensis]SMB96885.1 hypothetical protein SAMN00808754_1701 [Thermanaeromonas toyohensis ToBE]
MAVLWVSRKFNEPDPLKATLESLKQAFVETRARKLGLKTEYTVVGDCIELAVEGNSGAISALLKEIYEETGMCGFVVDVEAQEERKELDKVVSTPIILAEVVDI